ncbi:uncharacterized protein A4U43_C04F26970 [Asparagus officinalis]|uniref:Uncharacterized protein n=1 Tax=Asparagus officinalis TaxID=4686 RepID=A0A5P1F4I5_ASPOF|nr:uncharacterized protein A4U43_C04F26970 [Asparagus officinalis]
MIRIYRKPQSFIPTSLISKENYRQNPWRRLVPTLQKVVGVTGGEGRRRHWRSTAYESCLTFESQVDAHSEIYEDFKRPSPNIISSIKTLKSSSSPPIGFSSIFTFPYPILYANLRSSDHSRGLDSTIAQSLKEMFDEYNPFAKSFRMAKERFDNEESANISLRLIRKRHNDGRTYNLSITSEVAALIVGDVDSFNVNRDIIVESQSDELKRINEPHPSYLPISSDHSRGLDSTIAQSLKEMFDEYNPFTKSFRMAKERFDNEESANEDDDDSFPQELDVLESTGQEYFTNEAESYKEKDDLDNASLLVTCANEVEIYSWDNITHCKRNLLESDVEHSVLVDLISPQMSSNKKQKQIKIEKEN